MDPMSIIAWAFAGFVFYLTWPFWIFLGIVAIVLLCVVGFLIICLADWCINKIRRSFNKNRRWK